LVIQSVLIVDIHDADPLTRRGIQGDVEGMDALITGDEGMIRSNVAARSLEVNRTVPV